MTMIKVLFPDKTVRKMPAKTQISLIGEADTISPEPHKDWDFHELKSSVKGAGWVALLPDENKTGGRCNGA